MLAPPLYDITRCQSEMSAPPLHHITRCQSPEDTILELYFLFCMFHYLQLIFFFIPPMGFIPCLCSLPPSANTHTHTFSLSVSLYFHVPLKSAPYEYADRRMRPSRSPNPSAAVNRTMQMTSARSAHLPSQIPASKPLAVGFTSAPYGN